MPFPTINTCLVCEGARAEIMGKFTLLGYYGVAPYVRISIQNFNVPVQLCFVFAGGGPANGDVHIELRITAPNGATFNAPAISAHLNPQATVTNCFMTFLGVLPGPGNYVATLIVDGTPQYEAPFGLDQMQPGFAGVSN